MELKLPIDVTNLPQFRDLRELLGGDVGRAFVVWWTLWQELGYRAQDGVSPGRLPGSDVPKVVAAFQPYEANGKTAREIFTFFGESKLLRADGADWVCPRFALLHKDLNPLERSNASKGGTMKAFNARQQAAQEGRLQLGLTIAPENFKDTDGQPLGPEEARLVQWLVTTLDNALGKQPRPNWNFTESLIADAAAVLRSVNEETLKAIALELVKKRGHPLLENQTAERLLMADEQGGREINRIVPKLTLVAA